ncbi:MAG: hypothetical protein ACI4WU_03960, partial [Bacilli bacterium]
MKNLKINKNKIKALLGAIVISTNLTACSFKKADTKQTYSLENSILENDDVQYLYVNDTLVPISDVKLMDKSKNIIESVDGVLVNSEIMNISNPVEIKFSNDIEGVILGNKIIPVTEFTLVNGNTKEEITSIEGVFIDNKLVSVSLNDNSLIDSENDDIGYTDIDTDEEYELLTTEKFEDLCAERIKAFNDVNLPVNETDVIVYIMGTNSDKLAEDNKELIAQIVGDKSEIEVINDFGKVCAAIAMKNFESFQKDHSSENFIKVSDGIFGEQKSSMIAVEGYIDKIMSSYNDGGKVNTYVSELFDQLNSGDLSKLDDGVGFSMSTYLMILDAMDKSSFIALNEENRDMLAQLITSEKYVS